LITSDDNIVALIDGDIVAYKAAAIADGHGPDELVTAIKRQVMEWTQAVNGDRPVVFVSEGRNFRYDVYEPYKSHRKGQKKPPGVDYAKEWMLDKYDQVLSDPDLEADDRMGLYATEETEEVRVIVSTDKDLRQIPAYVFNPDKSVYPDRYSPEEGMQMVFFQWVCGDPVDGYPGIPGMGVKKYQRWLQELGPTSLGVFDLFESKELTREYCISQLLCSTIKHNHLPEPLQVTTIADFPEEFSFQTTYGEPRFWAAIGG